MKMEQYTTLTGNEMIAIYNEDGSVSCMTKEYYDYLETQKETELGGTL